MNKTFLLIDSNQNSVEQLNELLRKEGFSVISTNSHNSVFNLLKLPTDAILLSTNLFEIDCKELVRIIKQNPATSTKPLFVLSLKENDAEEIIYLELGADDYIVSPIRPELLLSRIRKTFRQRERFKNQLNEEKEIISYKNFSIYLQNYSLKVGQESIHFPKKEFEALVYIAKNYGRVVTRNELSIAVWGKEYKNNNRTVDVHIARIRKKLKQHRNIIATVSGIGYRFQI